MELSRTQRSDKNRVVGVLRSMAKVALDNLRSGDRGSIQIWDSAPSMFMRIWNNNRSNDSLKAFRSPRLKNPLVKPKRQHQQLRLPPIGALPTRFVRCSNHSP